MTLDLRARLSPRPRSCGWTTSSPTSRWSSARSLLKAVAVAVLLALYVSGDYPWRHLFSTIWIEAGIAALATPFVFALLDGGRRVGAAGCAARLFRPALAGGRILRGLTSVPLSSPREAPDGFRRRLVVTLAVVGRGVRLPRRAAVAPPGERRATTAHALGEQPHPPEARAATRGADLRSRGASCWSTIGRRSTSCFVPEDAHAPAGGARGASASFLQQDMGDARQALAAASASHRPPFEDIVVRRDLDWDDVVALETHQLELPGRVAAGRPAAQLSVRQRSRRISSATSAR